MDDSLARNDPPEKNNSYANAAFEHVEGDSKINGSSGLTESNRQTRKSVGKLERREQSSDESESSWTKLRRNAWLLPLVYSEFWISATFSLITAFFPILASSKHVDAWKYGFVFSAYKVAMLIGSLVAERIVAYKSPSYCYILGQGGFVLFAFIFGGLYWIPDGQILLGLALLFALLGGFTNTLYLVSMFAVVTSKFETHSGLIIASLEILFGSGTMAGSAIGGRLIDLWAYPLPFFVLGGITFLSLPFIVINASKLNQSEGQSTNTEVPDVVGARNWALLLDPVFLAHMVTLMMSWIILGFNEPTLEPSLAELGYNSTTVGNIFTVQFLCYAMGGVIAGTFCHYELGAYYAVIGHVFAIVGYILVGPAPFIDIERSYAIINISQVFIGLGMAAQFVCGYCQALSHVLSRGYPDNINTHSFVSSTVFTFLVFGAMVTAPLAGYLSETLGYRNATMTILGLLTAWLPVMITLWIRSICISRKSGELQKLLH
ncbi:conserved hypothetical protein [Ixodes scapularis]|uniref:MFS-type transporter SLC18B1 n=1 Tax=Ixodes scapularis TaxID=6945 RepID=B7P7T1_IXOSC|nr:conserved hypothetical protein [Ixodes scapularis]|eukprot:XP_002399563.1 conserved hypothetical protein [Ixodes scapularis]